MWTFNFLVKWVKLESDLIRNKWEDVKGEKKQQQATGDEGRMKLEEKRKRPKTGCSQDGEPDLGTAMSRAGEKTGSKE